MMNIAAKAKAMVISTTARTKKQPQKKKGAAKNRGVNPGFAGTGRDTTSRAPVRLGYSFGNNVPKFGVARPLGTLEGITLRTHSVSAPFAVTAVAGVQTPATQIGYALMNPSRLWVIGTFVTFPINPLLGASVATIAALFQYCFMRRCRIRYIPDNAGGTTATGTVALAWQADPVQAVPTSLPEMANNSVNIQTPVWKDAQIVVDSGDIPKNLRESYQIGTSTTTAASSYHMGAVYVGAENVAVIGNTGAGDVLFQCGRLEVECELHLWGITA